MNAALMLCLLYGGARLRIPGSAVRARWFPNLLGEEAAKRLMHAFGRDVLDIPLERKALLRVMLQSGWSQEQAAVALGISRRGVQEWWLKGGRPPKRPRAPQWGKPRRGR